MKKVFGRFGALVVCCLTAACSFASEFTAAGGSWFEPDNWTPSGVPGASDAVVISGKKTVSAAGSIVAGSLTLSDGATLELGSKTERMNVSATIAGDLTLDGASSFRVYSGEIADLSVFATAYQDPTPAIAEMWRTRNVVSVGGTFAVKGNSTVYPDYAPLTATPIVFTCDTLTLEEGSSFSTKGLGWYWSRDAYADAPAGAKSRRTENTKQAAGWTFAFGCGQSYQVGAGYGGNGITDMAPHDYKWDGKTCGRAYGFACAPFLSGSPAGFYKDFSQIQSDEGARGSGAIVVYAQSSMTVDGVMDADCKFSGTGDDAYGNITKREYGAASGGGVWLATGAEQIVFGPNAKLLARGGTTKSPATYKDAAGGRIALALGVTPGQMDTLATGEIPAGMFLNEAVDGVTADASNVAGMTELSGTVATVMDRKRIPVRIVGAGAVVEGVQTNTSDFAVFLKEGETVTLTAVPAEGEVLISAVGDLVATRETTFGVPQTETAVTVQFGGPEDPTHRYVGAADGDWFDPANWDIRIVPAANDNVLVDGKSVRVVGDLAVNGLALTNGASLAVGDKASRTNVTATVAGDVTLDGASSLTYYSGELADTNVFFTARTDPTAAIAELWRCRNVFAVGGTLAVRGNSTVYPDYAPLTATPIVFTCDTLFVEEGSSFSTRGRGWFWQFESYLLAPPGAQVALSEGTAKVNAWTWAFGTGVSYQKGGGYGANGASASGNPGSPGCAYGFAFAPFLSGAPAGAYKNVSEGRSTEGARGSGAITVYAKSSLTVDGTMDADCKFPGTGSDGYGNVGGHEFGAASGGGIWLVTSAASISFGANAALKARGGTTSTSSLGHGAGGRIAIATGVTEAQMETLATGVVPDGLYLMPEILGVSADVSSVSGRANLKGTVATVSDRRNLSVTVSGDGAVFCDGELHRTDFVVPVQSGTTMTLTAVPDAETAFCGWSGSTIPGDVTTALSVTVGTDEVGLVASFGSTTGVARSWTGASSQLWLDGRNWSPKGVPGERDDVTLAESGLKCLATNGVKVASLTVGNRMTLYVGGYNIQLEEFTEQRTAATVETSGDLTVTGGGRLVVYADELADLTPFATMQQDNATNLCAQLWLQRKAVRIGGDFTVTGSGSTVVPDAAPLTGRPVVFEVAGDFSVLDAGAVDASSRGWMWSTNDWANAPAGARQRVQENQLKPDGWCLAPGVGADYFGSGGSYGAYGKRTGGPSAYGGVKYGCAYGFRAAPFVPGSPSGLYYLKVDFFNPSRSDYRQKRRGGGAVTVIAKGVATVNGAVCANGGPSWDYCGQSGGGIWLVAGDFAFGAGAKLSAAGSDSANFSTYEPASGGRIALGKNVGERTFARLTTNGRLSSRKIRNLDAFLSAYPGVTVDLQGGLIGKDGSRVRVEIATGTFAWYEAEDEGMVLIVR